VNETARASGGRRLEGEDRPGDEDRPEGEARREGEEDRADRVARKLAVPVLIAALASIPATFLTLFEGTLATTGNALNTVSGAVLVAETVVLLALAGDKRAWLRRNRWLVALTVVIVPAVIFAVGPVQLLRLARVVGALRIIRVRRIFKAGRIVRDRHGLDGRWNRVLTFGVTALTAGFVAVVLTDPTSRSRQLLDDTFGGFSVLAIVLAGAVVAGATYVVLRDRD
jgi:CsoR family transcriptional regulator, copper-sensing transcriptional repressor